LHDFRFGKSEDREKSWENHRAGLFPAGGPFFRRGWGLWGVELKRFITVI